MIFPHYFRDFGYCNSGMIPWLRLIDLMSLAGRSLVDMVDERMAAYPCSEKINYSVAPNEATLERVFDRFAPQPTAVDHADGLNLGFDDWRFNLRAPNTEPFLRLNVESRRSPGLVDRQIHFLSQPIRAKE